MAYTLDRETYRDKVKGAWLGKTIGGTLGAPYEGRVQTLTLDFYSPIPAQPAPNDDLDLQLVWLDALKQHGAGITTNDLTQAWLAHVLYSTDEYGFAKGNLQRGLLPPSSGAINNPFNECIGGAIRSEIWALVAPAAPAIAARYAYQDGCIDHQGDGVWGEMFFAAIQSAAFVVSDVMQLVEIGRSFIPPDSRVAQAIQAVIAAFNEGISWQEARQRVISAVGSSNFTDAPQNVGFTVIGLLWKKDFGGAVCTAVNCGYNTGGNGATLGALWGIINGASGIPAEWTRPVGDKIIAGWGIKGIEIPATIDVLTEQTIAAAEKVISERIPTVQLVDKVTPPPIPEVKTEDKETGDGEKDKPVNPFEAKPKETEETASVEPTTESVAEQAPSEDVTGAASSAPTKDLSQAPPPPPPPATIDIAALSDNSSIKPLWTRSAYIQEARSEDLAVSAAFDDPPIAMPGFANNVIVTVTNISTEGISGTPSWTTPSGWEIAARQNPLSFAPGASTNIPLVIRPGKSVKLEAKNPITLSIGGKSVSFSLLRPMKWGVIGPFPNIESTGFDKHFPPEDNADPNAHFLVRSDILEKIEPIYFRDCFFDIDRYFRDLPGVVYLRTWVVSPIAQDVNIVAACDDGMRVYLHKQEVFHYHFHEPFIPRPVRPFVGKASLKAGKNELLLKVVRCAGPVKVVFYITDLDGHQIPDLDYTFGD